MLHVLVLNVPKDKKANGGLDLLKGNVNIVHANECPLADSTSCRSKVVHLDVALAFGEIEV